MKLFNFLISFFKRNKEKNSEEMVPIKGNKSANGSKIYHMPGQRFYEKINPNEYFQTEEEAQAAGYRRSKV